MRIIENEYHCEWSSDFEDNYIDNKIEHNEYLWFNPHVGKNKFINLYSTGIYE